MHVHKGRNCMNYMKIQRGIVDPKRNRIYTQKETMKEKKRNCRNGLKELIL